MKYHIQQFKHDPDNGQYGDCYRTAIACILNLEIEDVPHFFHDGADKETCNARVSEWLRERNLALFSAPYDCSLNRLSEIHASLNPGALCLLSGKSKTGTNHTVIFKDGKIIHDPSPINAGIIAPCIDEANPEADGLFYWVEVLAIQG